MRIHVSAGTCTSTWRKRFRAHQTAPGRPTTRQASLKREYHYSTFHLPVINLAALMAIPCQLLLMLFDSPYAAPAPRPFPPPVPHYSSSLKIWMFTFPTVPIFFTPQGKGRMCASCPPHLSLRAPHAGPAPQQSKTRDGGTETKLEPFHTRCSSSYPNFHPPTPFKRVSKVPSHAL